MKYIIDTITKKVPPLTMTYYRLQFKGEIHYARHTDDGLKYLEHIINLAKFRRELAKADAAGVSAKKRERIVYKILGTKYLINKYSYARVG